MTLRYRRMKPEDVTACVSFLLKLPLYGQQYAADPESTIRAWTALAGLDSFRAVLFEEVIDGHTRLLGPGVNVVVTDDFAREMKTSPSFWLGPELAGRVTSGRSPLLSNDQLRRANATTGINLVAWPSGPSPEDSPRMDINHLIMGTFVDTVRGYKLKELFFQTPVAEEAMAVLRWGAAIAMGDRTRTDFTSQEIQTLVKSPYVLVMNAELATGHYGSWASGLFVLREPQIGFSRSEQRLLEEALRGGTDEELARELEISLSAIKKAWRSVYDRVDRSKVGILPTSSDDYENGDRGKGKKHRLLAYIREHPEELRPISLKHLRHAHEQKQPDPRTSAGTVSRK